MKEALERYVSNTAHIRSLSSPKLSEVEDAAGYSMLLRDNFLTIGRLAAENRAILEQNLFPYLDSDAIFDEETTEVLGAFGDTLLDAYNLDNLDPAIYARITGRLIRSAEQSGSVRDYILQLDREIMSCYTMMNITLRLHSFPDIAESYRARGFAAWQRMLPYLEKTAYAALPDDECRRLVLVNARYINAMYEGAALSEEKSRENYELLLRSLRLADDPFYREQTPDYDWRNHIFRTLYYIALLPECHNQRRIPVDLLSDICDHTEEMSRLWHSDPSFYTASIEEKEMQLLLLRARYHAGRLDAEDYRQALLQLYERRDAQDYSLGGMMLHLLLPTEYFLTLDPSRLSEPASYRLGRFYRNILDYSFRMSGTDSLSFILEYLSITLYHFVEIPGKLSFQDMCLNCLAALHPPTYVHSITVAQITRCLARHLLLRRPSLFDALPMAGDSEAILAYAYDAALCHDFGKLLIADTIMVYGRRLLDEEFRLLKTHPSSGAALLASHESTRRYANVARAHHLWYDGTHGYPEDFDAQNLPEKVIIDLVTCADCLDAATDTVGRSYASGKTIDDFIAELREGAGTRYAPYLAELLEEPALRRDLDYLISAGRRANYTRTYQRLRDLTERSIRYGA